MTSPLARYPRPNVAVDLAILTVRPGRARDPRDRFAVLIQDRAEEPAGSALPGRFVRHRQTVEETIAVILRDKVGVPAEGVVPRLLGVADDPDRDPRGWTMAILMSVALPWEQAAHAHGSWHAVTDRGGVRRRLLFDHDHGLRTATRIVRDEYETAPDPAAMLGEPFTMAELHRLHEAVLGATLRWDTFKRRMEPQLVEAEAPEDRVAVGRPPKFYLRPAARSDEHDTRWRLPGEGGGVPRSTRTG